MNWQEDLLYFIFFSISRLPWGNPCHEVALVTWQRIISSGKKKKKKQQWQQKHPSVQRNQERDSRGPKSVRKIIIILSLFSLIPMIHELCLRMAAVLQNFPPAQKPKPWEKLQLTSQKTGQRDPRELKNVWEIGKLKDRGDAQILYANWQKPRPTSICALTEEASVNMVKALRTELLFTPTPEFQTNPWVNRHKETQTSRCRLWNLN